MPEQIQLIQPILGMEPFVLIELAPASDGSGDPALHVRYGGGVTADEVSYLPLLALTQSPPEGNPMAEMLRKIYRETGPTSTGEGTVRSIVREINSDWIEFVEAD